MQCRCICWAVPVLGIGLLLGGGLLQRGSAQTSLVTPTILPPLTVRGTVEAIDLRHTAFVLRVQTHTRIVYLTPDTDTHEIPAASAAFPAQLQARVTVGGFLQPNGTVLASLLTPRILRGYVPPSNLPDRILFGVVSATSDRLRGRDIKIRLVDGTETKIKVGRGIPVTRADQSISIHDLHRGDEARVVGTLDGTDFKAARIDALPPVAPASAPAALPVPAVSTDHAPGQPGL